MISAIVAVDKDWGIGYQGQLLEHLPPDMKYFKEITSNNTVVMGRKTWDSLPLKPLPNRLNLIVTKNPIGKPIENNYQFVDMGAAIEIILTDVKTDVFVIGGGKIYKELLPYCDQVYVTQILKNHENVDTYFPNLDIMTDEWELVNVGELCEYNSILYRFLTYKRV